MDAYNFIENKIDSSTPISKKFLEIGCGDGIFLKKLVNKYNAYGVGVDPYVTEELFNNFKIIKDKAENVANLQKRFDCIYTIKSFHHFDDPEQFLKSLQFVIAWRGKFLLLYWHKGAKTGIPEYYYSIEEVTNFIDKFNFKILKKEIIENMFYIETTLKSWRVGVSVDSSGKSIYSGMFGQAPLFSIFEISENKISFIEFRKNIYAKEFQSGKTLDVYNLLSDCQILLAYSIGEKGQERLRERGVYLLFDSGNVYSVLEKIFL